MKRVYITPNVSAAKNTAVANGTADVVYTSESAAYNSKGCDNVQGECGGYNAVMSCLLQIYQGVRACGTMMLVDKDGNAIDTDRIDSIDVTLMNEYGCAVYWFSTSGEEDYNHITFLQTKVGGDIISCETYADFMRLLNDETTFVESCILERDEEGKPMLIIGTEDCGSLILGDITSKGNMSVDSTCGLGGSVYVKWDGLPRGKAGGEIEMENVNGSDSHVLEFYGKGVMSSFHVSGDVAIVNKGKISLCVEGYESTRMMPANLTAYITIKFKDDDEIEQGNVYIIECVRFGRVYKNHTLEEGIETPLITYEVRPEHVSYDNTESGLESTNVKDALEELNSEIIVTEGDKHAEIYIGPNEIVRREGIYNDGRVCFYWEVRHNLGVKDVDIKCFVPIPGEVDKWCEAFGYDIELYDKNVAYVYFTELPQEGKAIVN